MQLNKRQVCSSTQVQVIHGVEANPLDRLSILRTHYSQIALCVCVFMMGCFVQTHRNKAKKINRNLFPFHLIFRSLIFLSNQKLPVLSRRAHTHTHTRGVCFYLDLLGCPLVQIDRLDSGDVDSKVPVDPGTADTHEHPEVPGSPART